MARRVYEAGSWPSRFEAFCSIVQFQSKVILCRIHIGVCFWVSKSEPILDEYGDDNFAETSFRYFV